VLSTTYLGVGLLPIGCSDTTKDNNNINDLTYIVVYDCNVCIALLCRKLGEFGRKWSPVTVPGVTNPRVSAKCANDFEAHLPPYTK
jgi:hypothetical protein